jgi:hypothetical protein
VHRRATSSSCTATPDLARTRQGLIEFIIEERGGKREQDACETSAPVDFVLAPDDEVCSAYKHAFTWRVDV